ncbi:MAG: MATE family efflux transporter, partial [Marinovum sp.]|nr:MATE family efflux transporter [Marinovum sp.]
MYISDAYRSQIKKMISLGAPLAAGYIVHVSIGVTDTIMLGRYSVDALAAVVLGSTFFFVFFIVGSGFGHAVMPLVASAVSSGDNQQIRRVTRMALWLSALFSVASFGLFWFSGAVLQM